jgi:hypothetical protein
MTIDLLPSALLEEASQYICPHLLVKRVDLAEG